MLFDNKTNCATPLCHFTSIQKDLLPKVERYAKRFIQWFCKFCTLKLIQQVI